MPRVTLVVVLALFAATPALAQPSAFGIGGQLGDPTGVTMRIGTIPMSVDIAAGWNIKLDRFFGQVHLIVAHPQVAPAMPLHFFYGPGAFVGAGDDRTELGASLIAGLAYYTGPFEVFGQLTPRLRLIESTGFGLGGGIGLRYYF